MKLNIDCVRDVLLALEDAEFGDRITIAVLCEKLDNKYTEEKVEYTCLKLDEGGLIEAELVSIMGTALKSVKAVDDITWEGHKFLDTVRDNKVWKQTKGILSKVSSASISFTAKIASQVLTNLISQQMGLNPIA